MKKPFRNLLAMAIASVVLLFAVAPLDQFLAKAAWYFSWQFMADFFNMNLYEHGVFGMADIVVTVGAGALIVYGLSFLPAAARLRPYRRGAGFILNVGFTMAVSIVHSIKWVTSRTRPHDWFPLNLDAYSHWWEFGHYPLQVGFNRGAFPGGHVATMSVLLTFFYLMPGDKRSDARRYLFAGFIILLALLMGWYRMMTATHWLTDNLASLFLSIMVVYGYYHFLHYPDEEIRARHPWTASLDLRTPGWEILFMAATFVLSFAAGAIVIGGRIAFLQGDLWFGLGVSLAGVVGSLAAFDANCRVLLRQSALATLRGRTPGGDGTLAAPG